MDEELENFIELNIMFYVNSKGKGIWIQGDKKRMSMSNMSENHLKNCIHRVKKDIKDLKERYRFKTKDRIADKLIPIAEDILNQLKDEYESRI
jgi:sensor domain CHASE-containing protein